MPPESPGSSQPVQIRKYPNRRYYDTTRSRHVTLEEIHQFIRDGQDVQVTDSSTGEDITPKVLAQIIIELDPIKLDIFPSEMLHRIIRSNEQLITDFVDKYFNHALKAFLESRKAYEEFLRQSLGLGAQVAGGTPSAAEAPTMDWMRAMMNPLASPLWAATSRAASTSATQAGEAGASQAQALRQVVEDLRREVEELRQQVRKPPTASRSPGKA